MQQKHNKQKTRVYSKNIEKLYLNINMNEAYNNNNNNSNNLLYNSYLYVVK